MALIPEVKLSELRKLNSKQIRELKSCIVKSDDDFVCIVIVPPANAGTTINDTIKTEAEYLGMRGNSVGGKEIDEV